MPKVLSNQSAGEFRTLRHGVHNLLSSEMSNNATRVVIRVYYMSAKYFADKIL